MGAWPQDNDLQMMEDMAKYLRAEEVPYDGRHSEMKNVIWCGVHACCSAPPLLSLLPKWGSERLRSPEQVGVECKFGALPACKLPVSTYAGMRLIPHLVPASASAPERWSCARRRTREGW